MADLLRSSLPSYSNFSRFSPLSPPLHFPLHPNFSIIRFVSLRRRFSQSLVIAKFSAESSQFDIISRTEHSDGTVIFKFGDTSEISQTVDILDGGNEVELEREGNNSLANEANAVTVTDDESDSSKAEIVIMNSGDLKEITNETADFLLVSQSDAQFCEDSIVDEQNSDSTSTTEVENSIVDNALAICDSSVGVLIEKNEEYDGVESSVLGVKSSDCEASNKVVYSEGDEIENGEDEIEKANKLSEASDEMSDDGKLIYDGDGSSNSCVISSDVNASNMLVSLEDKIEKANEENEASEEISDDDKLEHGGDASSNIGETSWDVKASDMAVTLENEIEEEILVSMEDEDDNSVEVMSDDDKLEYNGDESSNLGVTKAHDEASDMVVSLEDKTEKANEVSEASEEMSDDDKLEHSGDAPFNIGETSYNDKASVMVVALENEIEEDIVVSLEDEDEDSIEFMTQGSEAEPFLDEETSSDSVDDVVALESTLGLNKENGASRPTMSQSVDDQQCSDISLAAGPESSGIASANISLDRAQIATVANFLTSAALSSPKSIEIDDATFGIALSDDDLCDFLIAAGPFTPEITSAETSLDSLNEVGTSAPASIISSAVASLTDSLEALTGGKDAYFVLENWFGVADGVGQWSLEGVNMGPYAHELMENCEKVLKSMSAESTNAKELLQQSAAMTQSTGSARVLVAHITNQVLHVANIGDSGFVIIRNGTIFKKSSPMLHEFSFPYAIGLGDDSVEDVEEYHIELEDGDVIVTATDGLFDNLYEQEIASIVSKALETGMYVQELAELLAIKSQEVGKSESARSPFADAAQAAGHFGYSGGKPDHVTVIVSLVQRR